jgi:hypothetical protein
MQIQPSNSWTNPAALTQQSLSDNKHAAAATHHSTEPHAVERLENAEKTGDRDANERYDGPDSQSNGSSNQRETSGSESMLSLPAIDDQPESTLDLRG